MSLYIIICSVFYTHWGLRNLFADHNLRCVFLHPNQYVIKICACGLSLVQAQVTHFNNIYVIIIVPYGAYRWGANLLGFTYIWQRMLIFPSIFTQCDTVWNLISNKFNGLWSFHLYIQLTSLSRRDSINHISPSWMSVRWWLCRLALNNRQHR